MPDDRPTCPAVGRSIVRSVRQSTAYRRGVTAHEAGDWNAALSVFRELASEGHGPSEFMLGTMYHWGEGVGRDLITALGLYLHAFDHGDVRAAHRIGGMHATGNGVGEDPVMAARWYLRAAEQDHAPSQFTLGTMYASGTGVEKDQDEAARWLQKAADGGHVHARHDLAAVTAARAASIDERVTRSGLPADCQMGNT